MTRYLKPWTTLLVGVGIGYWVVPKVMQKVG